MVDWSSDVCSSDLYAVGQVAHLQAQVVALLRHHFDVRLCIRDWRNLRPRKVEKHCATDGRRDDAAMVLCGNLLEFEQYTGNVLEHAGRLPDVLGLVHAGEPGIGNASWWEKV